LDVSSTILAKPKIRTLDESSQSELLDEDLLKELAR
jgi:hypothetical protein